MSRPPVILFVYNRLTHAICTVEALQKNHGACDSVVYIFSDGPRNQADEQSVAAVRHYIAGVKGFSDVIIVERERNLGLSCSLIRGITEVFNAHESIIVLEDDLVTSPFFLQFMNDAMRQFEQEEQVVAVHGYTFPLGIPLPEMFFLRHTGCWGWGTWKRGWELFEPDGLKLLRQLQDQKLTKNFDMNGAYPYTQMLEDHVNGKNDSWAVRWHASTFLKNKLTLYPGVSLVKNTGHDGSGAHCCRSSFYDVSLVNRAINVSPISVCEDLKVASDLASFFRKGHSGFLRYWAWKLFGKSVTG